MTVLAGNVFSAAVRPLLLPLLCGTPVLAKASSRDAVLPLALAEGLRAIDSRLAAACGVLAFAHGDGELDREWLGSAELVSAYGSDETLAAIERQLASSSRLLRHGHGYGLLAISSDALPSEAACEAVAARAALDVIAYDQRGCLSPQLVLVERGGRVSPREFAAELARALEQRALELPRGPLDPHAAAAQAQWRGVAAALGELHLGASSAVSYEDGGPLRPSPGHRNLAVHACDDTSALVARVQPLRPQLKALGVAGERTANALAGFAPYTCEVGAMQTPPLEARLDGLHPLEGFG